ncbi:LysR substrate-binding domain-containing protein [Pigmentiphaga sp. YJ18]|uniref:LysR family transcriptional regulator n=1 Tax=Pigmentiphaga sp. YJ18 TaxID=3134907 RepID=UPI0031143AC3
MDFLATARLYTRVVELGSMSAAAREFEMGQPAVSERIDRLEKYLSTKLLMRSARTLACTHEGQLFYDHSKALLALAETAIASVSIRGKENLIRGPVRIASAHCPGEILLPSILMRARMKHPELRIDLVLNDTIVDPITEGVDISLRLGHVGEGRFVAYPLGNVRRVLVAAPSFLKHAGSISVPSDLSNHPFIRSKGTFANEQLPLITARQDTEFVRIQTMVTTSHWRPLYELLIAGGGIGVLHYAACANAVRSGALVRVLPSHSIPELPFHALVQGFRPASPRIRAVLEILKTEIPLALQQASAPLAEE